MAVAFKDLSPGCIVLIAAFDDISEHQFLVEEVFEDLVTGVALTGPLAGEYGEPDIELIVQVTPLGTAKASEADS
jgi:hypothetical protein